MLDKVSDDDSATTKTRTAERQRAYLQLTAVRLPVSQHHLYVTPARVNPGQPVCRLSDARWPQALFERPLAPPSFRCPGMSPTKLPAEMQKRRRLSIRRCESTISTAITAVGQSDGDDAHDADAGAACTAEHGARQLPLHAPETGPVSQPLRILPAANEKIQKNRQPTRFLVIGLVYRSSCRARDPPRAHVDGPRQPDVVDVQLNVEEIQSHPHRDRTSESAVDNGPLCSTNGTIFLYTE